MLPARQVLPADSSSRLSEAVASHPVASLTAFGVGLGAFWGAGLGAMLGSVKVGAAIGAAALGFKGYRTGKDSKSWLK